jgi:ADP-ribose pyrophosphatase
MEQFFHSVPMFLRFTLSLVIGILRVSHDGVNKMTNDDILIENEEWMYQGFISVKRYNLKHKLYGGGWSNTFTREMVIRKHAAAVLPYDPILDRVILIQQFRIGALEDRNSAWLYEIVAGLMDKDETPEQVVKREMQEEAGVEVLELVKLYNYWMSPGGSNEFLTLFCAKVDASQAGGIHGLAEENEDIKVQTFSSAEAFEMIKSGEVRNCSSVLALQWLELHRESLRERWL